MSKVLSRSWIAYAYDTVRAPIMQAPLPDCAPPARRAAAAPALQIPLTRAAAAWQEWVRTHAEERTMNRRFIRAAALAVTAASIAAAPGGAAPKESRYARILADPMATRKLAAAALLEESRIPNTELAATLAADPNPLVRLRCAEALGRIGTAAVVRPLAALAGDPDERVVLAAVVSLGLTGEEAAVEPLTGILASGSPAVREAAARALGRCGNRAAVGELETRLTDFHGGIRAAAATALALIGDSTAAAELSKTLEDPAPRVIAAGLYALGRLGATREAKRIVERLEHEEPFVRRRAAEALGRLKVKAAASALAALAGEDPLTAAIAATALGRIGGKEGARGLEAFLDSGDPLVRTAALRGLAAIGRSDSRDRVLPLLTDDSEMVRRAAIEAAAATGGAEAAPRIIPFLSSDAAAVRMTALEALGRAGRPCDLAVLLDSLEAGHTPLAREGAAAGLGRWPDRDALRRPVRGDTTVVDILFEAADDADWVVGSIAATSIGHAGGPDAVAPLVRVFTRHNDRVDGDRKLAVIEALGEIAARETLLDSVRSRGGSFLRLAARHADPRVAEAAAAIAPRFGERAKAEPKGVWKRGRLPWQRPALPMGPRWLLLDTARGEVVIELFGDDAPGFVRAILALAEAGFYENRSFHRVVPGFVAQGGCPRGDGWGDAGFFLRSQWNAHSYERGTVGMAHAGPDTPGTQFFICHWPQPHLDGRYTVVGRVTSGMDVVDRIEEGDLFSAEVIGGPR